MEPRTVRRTPMRADLVELGERVTRLEAKAEHIQEAVLRIDTHLGKMEGKIDKLASTMAQGVGGLRAGVVVGQVAAGVIGFLVARFWPAGK